MGAMRTGQRRIFDDRDRGIGVAEDAIVLADRQQVLPPRPDSDAESAAAARIGESDGTPDRQEVRTRFSASYGSLLQYVDGSGFVARGATLAPAQPPGPDDRAAEPCRAPPRSSGSAISESRSSSTAASPAASVGTGSMARHRGKRQRPLHQDQAAHRGPAEKGLMRSISSGARCCTSSAAVGASCAASRPPSRPSAAGQVDAAQSAPTMAAQSALRRTSMPPPRLATTGAASFDTATPTA